MLDAVLDEAVRLYDLAGAARADKITGDPATRRAAIDHLIGTGTLRVICRDGILPELRVFAVDPE